jgi:hypothetical protein
MLHEYVSFKFSVKFLISANARVEKDVPHVIATLRYCGHYMHVGVMVVGCSLSHIPLLNRTCLLV